MSNGVDGLRPSYLFALAAHEAIGQKRKFTLEPYINHPVRVARTLSHNGFSGSIIDAALLHDVVEDTHISINSIFSIFGEEVGTWVKELTKEPLVFGNRKERSKEYCRRLSEASKEAQTIKYADILDNVWSVKKGDPKFAEVYIPECMDKLDAMTKGDPELRKKAIDMCKDAMACPF